MKLVAGLGNVPTSRYGGTRHNVGFDVVDVLAGRHATAFDAAPTRALQARWGQGAETVWLMKPLTLMNLSGEAIGAACRFYRIVPADVLIVCDDVNLPLGRLRVRSGGSEGGHNGLRSIAEHLGTLDYPRLRIGVGRGDTRRDLAAHVLAKFAPEERSGIEDAIARAADAVETWVSAGLAQTMNLFNREAAP